MLESFSYLERTYPYAHAKFLPGNFEDTVKNAIQKLSTPNTENGSKTKPTVHSIESSNGDEWRPEDFGKVSETARISNDHGETDKLHDISLVGTLPLTPQFHSSLKPLKKKMK